MSTKQQRTAWNLTKMAQEYNPKHTNMKTIGQTIDDLIVGIVEANPGRPVHVRTVNASGRKVQCKGYLSVWETKNFEALSHHVEPVDEDGIVRLVIEF